eukprot:UN03880
MHTLYLLSYIPVVVVDYLNIINNAITYQCDQKIQEISIQFSKTYPLLNHLSARINNHIGCIIYSI